MSGKSYKVRAGDGFEIVSASDYDPEKHHLVVDPGEIVVKPKGVEGAKPFIIDEKDFDERSYERVNQTAAVIEEVAKQQERQTAEEAVEARKSDAE